MRTASARRLPSSSSESGSARRREAYRGVQRLPALFVSSPMTYTFHVGEPTTTRTDGARAVAPPSAVASAGPGGLQILVALEAPGEAERRAVESGPIALGVSDGAEAEAILVRIGTPGEPGYVEVSAVADVGEAWWGGRHRTRSLRRGGRRARGPSVPGVGGPGGLQPLRRGPQRERALAVVGRQDDGSPPIWSPLRETRSATDPARPLRSGTRSAPRRPSASSRLRHARADLPYGRRSRS